MESEQYMIHINDLKICDDFFMGNPAIVNA